VSCCANLPINVLILQIIELNNIININRCKYKVYATIPGFNDRKIFSTEIRKLNKNVSKYPFH